MSTMVIDGATPLLLQLKQFAPNFANEALSKAGSDLQKAMKRKAKSMGSHKWGLTNDGKITYNKRSKKLFSRENKSTGSKLHGLENFIYFKQYPNSTKVIVGFMDTKSFSPIKFRDGKEAGKMGLVKGTKTKAIGQRMELGGKETLSTKQKALFFRSGFRGIASRGYVKRQPHAIVRPTFAAKSGQTSKRIQNGFLEAVQRLTANSSSRRTA